MPLYQVNQPSRSDEVMFGIGQGLKGFMAGQQNRVNNQMAERQLQQQDMANLMRYREMQMAGAPKQPGMGDIVSLMNSNRQAAETAAQYGDMETANYYANQNLGLFNGIMRQFQGVGLNGQRDPNMPSMAMSQQAMAGGQPKANLRANLKSKTENTYSKPIVSDGTDGFPKGTLYQTGPTGEIQIKYTPKDGTSVDPLEAGTVLRKEFNSDKIRDDYNTISRAAKQIEQAYNMSIKPGDKKSRVASDQALAVSFQKMLDPSSVVRESEYARTPEGIALMSKLEAVIPQLQQGGLMISDHDRRAILDMANTLLIESQKTMNEHIERYQIIADQYGVAHPIIFGNIKPFEIKMQTPVEQAPPNVQKFLNSIGASKGL